MLYRHCLEHVCPMEGLMINETEAVISSYITGIVNMFKVERYQITLQGSRG